jgi:hypothetical protein
MASDAQQSNSKPTLKPGEYLPLRVMAFPSEKTGPLPFAVNGTTEEKTTAYLFSYPFDILTHPELSGIYDVKIDGHRVTIYPPFSSRTGGDANFVENVPLKNIPRRPNTIAPDLNPLVAPDITVAPKDSLRRTDSLRLDCPKELPYEFAATAADKCVGLIRWRTMQWWIKRGREHSRTHIRNWFRANELGERLSGVGVFRFFYGKIGCERLLDSRIWGEVAQCLSAGQSIPFSWDIFFDAIYFHSTDDVRRSILETAISNEFMLTETLEAWVFKRRIERSKMQAVLRGSNYLAHLARAGKLWGRSFEHDYPNNFKWVKAAWIARGNVAHGKAPFTLLPQGIDHVTLKDMISVFASVIALREWFDKL